MVNFVSQVVSNSRRRFIHAFCGIPGSVHDMRAFRYSGLQNKCSPAFFPPNTHLLADSAYTLQENVIVRYRDHGHLTVEQEYHNRIHSQIRSSVERTIWLLKCRWRVLLDKFPMKRLDLMPYYVIACCVLHNLALMTDNELVFPIIIPDVVPDNIGPLFPTAQQQISGQVKRQGIKNILNN